MKEGSLLRKYLKVNEIEVSEFAKNMGVSRNTVYRYFETERFSEKIRARLQSLLGVDVTKIRDISASLQIETTSESTLTVNETQSMYGTPTSKEIKEIAYSEAKKRAQPIDGEFFATISPAMSDVVAMPQDRFNSIPMFAKGEYMIPVTGNSMKGVINHGDWITIRRITNFREAIRGEIYLFVTKEDNLRTIKYLKRSSLGDEYVYMAPYNIEQFDGQDIHVSDILELWLVIGLVRMINM